MRFRWPFVLRSTYEEAISALARRDRARATAEKHVRELVVEVALATRARDVAETHARNVVEEVKVARDALDRILSWKASR